MAVQIISDENPVIKAISTVEDPALHYVLEGLFEHFLPSRSNDDLQWFLERVNSPPVMKSFLSSSVSVTPPVRCMKQCLLSVLTAAQNEEESAQNEEESAQNEESQFNSADVLERLLYGEVRRKTILGFN